MPSQVIVTTTINPPTEAIKKFDAMPDWHLVVAGDLRTPKDYRLARGTYLSPADQDSYDSPLSAAIGWNRMQRRNLAILAAYDLGAEVIAVVDDDNIPLPGWGQDLIVERAVSVRFYFPGVDVFDPVGMATNLQLWHRGFPLQLLQNRAQNYEWQLVCRPIQADFWNGDPDIDAICRMEHAPECDFDPAYFPMASDVFSPFNSQNTFIARRVIPDYFLFPGIGRMDDIWASYYVESLGHLPVYGKASVYQQRNEHNLTHDMQQEFLGYEHNLQLVQDLKKSSKNIFLYLPSRSAQTHRLYRRHFANA
jgi:hypothetical protein